MLLFNVGILIEKNNYCQEWSLKSCGSNICDFHCLFQGKGNKNKLGLKAIYM